MNVEFKESFLKDLRVIKDRSLLARAKEIIEGVEQASKLEDVTNIKKLKGERNYYRIRVGDFRIGLKIEGGLVTSSEYSTGKKSIDISRRAISFIASLVLAHLVNPPQ